MNKRIISMVLVLILALSLLAGCAGDSNEKPDPTSTPAATQQPNQTPDETEEPGEDYGDTGGLKLPITDKEVEVTWMTSHANIEWNDTPFIKELQKRTGVKVIVQDVPQDAYLEKVNTSLASKDMPNMMNVNLATANTYGEQGAFIALNKHLDLIPNFKSVIVDNPDNDWYLKSFSTEAGNIYGWPIMDLQRKVNHLYMYREDIFEKNGLEIWEAGDTEGFYETLKKLKEIYPDSVPMSSKMGNGFWGQQQPGWGLSYASMSFDHDTRTWEYARTAPEFKEMLDFFQKLYQEGLLDPELFTITSNDWVAKMAAPETSFVTLDWISRMDIFKTQVGDTNPEYELSPAPPIGPEGVHFPLPTLGYYGVVVSDITDNKLEALQVVDYLFSPSGATLQTIGVEGEWFNFDENDKPVYTDPELTSLEKIDINNLAEKYGLWNQSMYVRCDRRSLYHSLTEKEQAANDIIVDNDLFRPADPILRFSDAVLERNGEIVTNLDTKAYEFATQYLLNGDYGDAEWEKWVNEAKALGLEEIEKNHNDAQAVYDAN